MTAEAAARQGYDYVVIDLQHGVASEPEAMAMMQAADAAGAIPVVRVAANDPMIIGRALDAGALAVIVPMVNDAAAARAAVASCRYAPEGRRSYGPVAAMSRYMDDYANVANSVVTCVIMIETADALKNLDEILQVPGVDAVYVGPFDLSLMLGLPPASYHEDARFTAAIARILEGCARHRVVAGIHADASLSGMWATMGFRMITVGFDQQSVVGGLRTALDEARDATSQMAR
jgi:4-hydroxy-2-oxoheptanedioate aldolase